MAESHRITVALPTCNGARHLREALAGLHAQEGVSFDLIVSDDRSEDDSVAIVRESFGDRARVEVNSERLGLAGNWNRCVALSLTPWVAVFHQDDVMKPGHLAAHLRAAEAHPSAGLIASAADVIDADGAEVPGSVVGRGGFGPEDRAFDVGEAVPFMAVENPLRCSGVTIARDAHAEVGGFDPTFRYVVDWDFWLRVARRRPVAWLARPTVAIRWHPASETHRFKGGTADLDETARLLDASYRQDGPTMGDAPGLRRRADRRLARAFLNRAHEASREGDSAMVRRCLIRAVRLAPSILGTIVLDPRLMTRLTAALRPSRVRSRSPYPISPTPRAGDQ